MTIKIRLLMQNADNVEAVGRRSIEQHM